MGTKVVINGENKLIENNINIEQLLIQHLKFNSIDGIAVALNNNVVFRQNWKKTVLKDNDEIEIIHAVQGG